MQARDSRSSHIEVISRSLISIVVVICIFQLISFGLVIDRAVESYQQARQLADLDTINRDLFVATDLVSRERNLSQSLLAGHQQISPQQKNQLSSFRRQADSRFEQALTRMQQQAGIDQSMVLTPLRERWNHYTKLRQDIDRRLANPMTFADETLGYELSLASSDLMTKTNLAVHELTRKLGSGQDESIGRLAEASYLLWQVRNQVAEDGSALSVRAQLARPLNSSNEASLEAGRSQASNFMSQLQMEMRFLHQFPIGYRASELSLEVGRFHQLSSDQLAALTQGQRSPYSSDDYRQKTGVVQDHLITLFSRLTDQANTLIAANAQLWMNRLLRYILFLCVAIALNMTLLSWLRRRVLQPLSLLSTVHDAAREAILLINTSGHIFMANSGTELLFGLSGRHVRGMRITELLPEIALDNMRLAQLADSGEEIRTAIRKPDGSPFYISLIASPMTINHGQQGTLVIIRDDHARHLAEMANSQSLAALSEITRIQNLLFSQSSRHRVFNEVLEAILTYTHSNSGCLLEIRDSTQGQEYRCRSAIGLDDRNQDTAGSDAVAAFHAQLEQDARWMLFPVALQNAQTGLVGVYMPQLDAHREALETLLGLYASVLGFVSEEEWRKQSALQLHEVLRQQEALFSASPAGLIQIDQHARVLRTNYHASQIFGIEEPELLQLDMQQVLNAANAWHTLEQRITRVNEGKQAAPCELECRSRAGTLVWVLFEIRALYADRPRDGMIISCIDITALKNTETALREARDNAAEARSQLAAAIEAIPEAFAFYDENDCLVVCNQHYADLFFADLRAEQMIGKTFEIMARFSLEHGREVIESGFDKDSWIAERTRRHHQEQASFLLQIGDGWYQASDHQIAGLGSVCLRANITELKAQEQELRQATIKADEANRAKSAFLASISHEIRTPLNGILGLLELLRLTQLDRSQHDTLSSIQDSAQTLLRLIDDILDFSKIEAGKLDLQPEPTALRPILIKVHDLYHEMAASKSLPFELEIDPQLAAGHLADPLRLRQILQNFVSNAIKFTAQGKIALQVKVLDSNSQQQTLEFSCRDSGIGISSESLGSLFRPFTQAESSTTRRFGGTGLGLAICKRLAEQMGGEVALDSVPGQGTTAWFRVDLPLADAPEIKAEPVMSTAEAGVSTPLNPAGIPILFVEDNPTNRKLTTMQLERIGVRCKVAENGLEALELWRQETFSLVLTDCHMPIMDGHQLAQAIRAEEALHPERRPIPIIACTANIGQDEADRAIAAGMNQVLTKPIGLEPLRAMLNTWLGTATGTPELTTAVSPEEEVSALPIIDRASLEIYSQGDLSIEIGILQDFLSSEAEDMQALQKAVSEQNHKDARWSTHRIKGAGRMVGALPLANAAEALEICAKQELSMQQAFETLEQAFRQVEDWVSQQQQ